MIFEQISRDPAFWHTLRSDDLQFAIFALEPAQHTKVMDEDYLDDIAAAFAQVVDSKSPYTSGHSERVTIFSDLIAERLAFSPEQRRWRKRAALLHDIGKLGVSNSILDNPASSTRKNARRCSSTPFTLKRYSRASRPFAISPASPGLTTSDWTARGIRTA